MTTSGFLKADDRLQLQEIVDGAANDVDRKRAEILLGFDDGKSMREIADEVGASVQRVLFWRREFLKRGLGIFEKA